MPCVEFEAEEYTSRIAKDIREARELVEAGFEYVCDYNEEGSYSGNESEINSRSVTATLGLSLCQEPKPFFPT